MATHHIVCTNKILLIDNYFYIWRIPQLGILTLLTQAEKAVIENKLFVWTLLFCFESVFHESSNITIYLGAISALWVEKKCSSIIIALALSLFNQLTYMIIIVLIYLDITV